MEVLTRALAALAALLICIGWTSPARAVPSGVVLDRIDLTLEIPDPGQDDKLQTRHTIVLHTTTSSYASQLTFGFAPSLVRASDVTTGAQVMTTRRTTDDAAYLDVTLPNGSSQVKLEFVSPLFETALGRFWWDETQIVLGWPFDPSLQPQTQGMMVTVFLPPSAGRPNGLPCVREAGRTKCSRFFTSAELARHKNSQKAGLVVGSIPETGPLPLVVSGGQIALWCLLLVLVTVWRLLGRGAVTRSQKLWMIAKTALALVLVIPCLIAFALIADGETEEPLAAAMTWAAAVFGIAGLMLAHMENRQREIRTKLGQLLIAGSLPGSVAAGVVTELPMVALWVAGGSAVVAFLLVLGKNED